MNLAKYPKRSRLPLLVVLLSLVITGCTGARMGVSWADLTLIEDTGILVSYNDYMVLVDPTNGVPIQLRSPDGQIRTDEAGNPRRWEIRGGESNSQFFSTPLWLNEDTLLVADYNDKLITVNFPNARVENANVAELPGHVFADLATLNGMFYVPTSDNYLLAFEKESFEELWRVETGRGIWAQPLVVDMTVYFVSIDHTLYAVDALTGEGRWSLDLGGAIAASPLHVDDRLYVGNFGRSIYEISLDGEIINEYKTENWVWNTPVLYDDILYAADLGGYVYALDTTSGLQEVWKTQVTSDGIRPSPLVTDEYVIVAARNGSVSWLDRATGEIRFSQSVDAEILSDILLVEPSAGINIPEPLVIVSTVKNDKILVAFTLEGAPRWTYSR